MTELLAHLFGDYVFQSHWMATRKRDSTLSCLAHVFVYGLMFLPLSPSTLAWSVLITTHFALDHWGLADYWCRFWGVGVEGFMTRRLRWWHYESQCRDRFFGLHDNGVEPPTPLPESPPWLATWLRIIVDNSFHLLINHLALSQL